MLTLYYPKRQTIALSNTLFKLYYSAINSDEKEIYFDLSKSETLTPFGIVMLTATILECRKRRKSCYYDEPRETRLREFFSKIGFNKFFGLDDISDPNLIETDTIQLRRSEGLDYQLTEKLTELFDYHLNISRGVKESLQMSLHEAMTNVIDHSGVNTYFVCAYTYKPQKQIRLCIADLGQGIKKSLESAPGGKYRFNNDYDAIKKATEDGVSSRKQRAGMGLAHIKQFLTINKGQLCIISSKGKVYWKFDQYKEQDQTMNVPFNGTILKMIINIDKEGFYFLSSEEDYLF